jgi:hypothetical protein
VFGLGVGGPGVPGGGGGGGGGGGAIIIAGSSERGRATNTGMREREGHNVAEMRCCCC